MRTHDSQNANCQVVKWFLQGYVLRNGNIRKFPASNADVDVVSVSARGMGNPKISDYDVIDGVLRNEKIYEIKIAIIIVKQMIA